MQRLTLFLIAGWAALHVAGLTVMAWAVIRANRK